MVKQGDQVAYMGSGAMFPVEPVGSDLSQGWTPGVWVSFATDPITTPNAVCTVKRSDGTTTMTGILLTGTQHSSSIKKLSTMWRGGSNPEDWFGEEGDTSSDFSKIDPINLRTYDTDGMLKRAGSRIVTVCNVVGGGIYKVYYYEKQNKAKRYNPSAGADLVWQAGDRLYVSENGLSTNEKESAGSLWTGCIVFGTGSDVDGEFIVISTGTDILAD